MLLHRDNAGAKTEATRPVVESLDALFALKHELLPSFGNVPYVAEELPVVCAWYPTAGTVALWNLSEQQQRFTTVFKDKQYPVDVAPLGMALLENLG